MGIGKLSWQEINAWLKTTGKKLSLWELSTIRRLSEEYASEYNQAGEKLRPAPFMADEIDRKEVATRITNVLANFKKQEPEYTIEE